MSDAPTLLSPLPPILQCGTINLLAGASGIGKTALLSQLLRQFELGAPILEHPTHQPPAIGYFVGDRSWQENRHWFDTAGVSSLRTLSLVDDDIKLPNQRMKHLRVQFFKECVAKMALPPGSLLVVDPMALFLGGNLLDYDTVAFACIEIQRWLREPQCQYCLIGVCHSSKQRADKNDRYLRLQDRISGSMAQLGFTSTQMFLAAPDETGDKDGRYTFLWNPHCAPAETFQFTKGDKGLFDLDHAITVTAGPLKSTEGLGDFELELYKQFPLDGTPVATATILRLYSDLGETGRRKIFRALDQLQRRELIYKIKHGQWARVPADPDALI